MKYRIFVISHSQGYDVELHNLEVEANPINLCFIRLEANISRHQAKLFANTLQIVLGADCCDVIEASRTEKK